MIERPILFNGAMVRALLDDSKTQTRRVFKQAVGPSLSVDCDERGIADLSWLYGDGPGHEVHERTLRMPCPYGAHGDRLWVRETWSSDFANNYPYERVWYAADNDRRHEIHVSDGVRGIYSPESHEHVPFRWHPSIHMPRAASRITLEVTGVRVERLQDITRGDAMDEGCPFPNMAAGDDPRQWFSGLWSQINGAESWAANPWVWVVEFKRIQGAA